MKNLKIKNLKSREYKYYKILYRFNIIKDCLENNNFILFFYYDFLNPQQRNSLKNKLKSQNLKTLIIKKNSNLQFLSDTKFKFLKNLLNNNTLIIYDKNNNLIDKKIIESLINEQNIKLIGGLWNKKLVRPSIIKKYSKINDNIQISTIISLKHNINKLKIILEKLTKKEVN